jgi:hypothetical protein
MRANHRGVIVAVVVTCDDEAMGRGTQGGLGTPPDDRRCTWEGGCKRWDWRDRLCRDHHEQARIEAEERRAAEVAVRAGADATGFDGDVFAALRAKMSQLSALADHFDKVVTELLPGGLRYRSKGGHEQLRSEWKCLMDAQAELRRMTDTIVRAGIAHRMFELKAAEQGSQPTRQDIEDAVEAVRSAFSTAVGDMVTSFPTMYGEADITDQNGSSLTEVPLWSERGKPGIPRELIMPIQDKLRECFRARLASAQEQARRQREQAGR